MTAVAAVGRRYLPRGWGDFGLQLAIWFGFLAVYQVARGVADRDPARAIANGLAVIGWERQHAHHLFELTLQNLASSSVTARVRRCRGRTGCRSSLSSG